MKVALADVLWRAANEHLASGRLAPSGHSWSCHALYAALYGGDGPWANTAEAEDFVMSLGCDPGQSYFDEFRYFDERQGVRYMWLLLAYHVALDERIYVEVSA